MTHRATTTDTQGHWQSRCGIQKIVQTDGYGCGIACLAMVTGDSYDQARLQFNALGFGIRRSGWPPYSTSSREMLQAVASAGLIVEKRRWRDWNGFNGLGVLKVRDDWRGAKGRWHWVVAFRHAEFGIVVLDPHQCDPSFQVMPAEVICVDFKIYQPKGEWFQVEQRMVLELNGREPNMKEQ